MRVAPAAYTGQSGHQITVLRFSDENLTFGSASLGLRPSFIRCSATRIYCPRSCGCDDDHREARFVRYGPGHVSVAPQPLPVWPAGVHDRVPSRARPNRWSSTALGIEATAPTPPIRRRGHAIVPLIAQTPPRSRAPPG